MVEENYRLKMAVISGASKGLEMKARNPKATDEEVIQMVTNDVDEIVKGIDAEEL
jgi:hypothetical protein